MCGITGYFTRSTEQDFLPFLKESVRQLSKRGPDHQSTKILSRHVAFGHARLSVIDTSDLASQPMQDASGRYTIIFNGEIFNYRQLRSELLKDVPFMSESDTEVLLYLYIKKGKECLQHLNGFFAFAVYDSLTQNIFLARDRFGIKPLHIYNDGLSVIFASELKALLCYPVKRELDYSTLLLYLQMSYIPDNKSMLKGITRLAPGAYLTIDSSGNTVSESYYQISIPPIARDRNDNLSYEQCVGKLRALVEDAVERRLVSDVPLGTFLSGGIDSSIVTACAAKKVSNLNSFSIGYTDEPFYDETKYANLVAKKYKTNHTVFAISSEEMFSHIFDMLDYIDEPFADSSSIAVYILCKKTRSRVTVALSGDGGDELFAGYNKHKAEYLARKGNFLNLMLRHSGFLFDWLPKSRHSNLSNTVRQLQRYAQGLELNNAERYWRWCVFQNSLQAYQLLKQPHPSFLTVAEERADTLRSTVTPTGDLNQVLRADVKMVLPGDMLTKVDLMSMANSLEVRVPLLDYTVVDFAFSLPVDYKLHNGNGKRILKDAFKAELPVELHRRPKHGFEVPIKKWIQTGLKSIINEDLLSDSFIQEQGVFDLNAVQDLKKRAFGSNPNDSPAVVWSLLVFQYWYKKYMLV